MACVGGLLLLPPCLYILYGRRVLAFASFPIYGDKNTISGLAGLAVLLAWCSCDTVGRPVCRSGARPVGRHRSCPSSSCGVVIIGSSLAAACLLLAHRLGLRCRNLGGGVLASPTSAGVVLLAVSFGGSGGVLVSCGVLFVLACLAMVSYRPPPRSIRQDGRGDAASAFLRRGSFSSVSRRRVFLARLCLLSYTCRRGGACDMVVMV